MHVILAREVIKMPELKETPEEGYLLVKKLGKLYLYLLILGRLVFLVERVTLPEILPVNSNIIDISKFMILSVIGNQFVKSLFFLLLVLYSMFVIIESFMALRHWFFSVYSKFANNKIIEKKNNNPTES
jgi:hypothetical protein